MTWLKVKQGGQVLILLKHLLNRQVPLLWIGAELTL